MAVPQNTGSTKLFITMGLIWSSLHYGRQAHGRCYELLFASRWPIRCSLQSYCFKRLCLTAAISDFSLNLPNSTKIRASVSCPSWVGNGRAHFLLVPIGALPFLPPITFLHQVSEDAVLLHRAWEDEHEGGFGHIINVILPINCN